MIKKIAKIVQGGGLRLKKKIAVISKNRIISRKYRAFKAEGVLIPIEKKSGMSDEISRYWTGHTVHDNWFSSAKESLEYRESIWEMYPFYREFADIDRNHEGEVILDYGCGPGNDLTWYTQKANPRLIIGADISISALKNAQFRMALHKIGKDKCRLMQLDDTKPVIPLSDNSIDFISCQGVLMHALYPEKILSEFYRILKKSDNSCCCIMVYNRDSIWFHLYAAYYLRFINPSSAGLSKEDAEGKSVDEIFRMSTDGPGCPMARCWSPDEFIEMCSNAGFKVNYMGGYTNSLEPDMAKHWIEKALKDERLEAEHKEFLKKVMYDENGYPIIEMKEKRYMCSIGGVYRLWKL